MGKSISSSVRLQGLTRIFSSSTDKLHRQSPRQAKPPRVEPRKSSRPAGALQKQILNQPAKKESTTMKGAGTAASPDPDGVGRSKLSQVVSDCVRRWFLDTLKEAKAGNSGMQVLVGQMYNSGYGVAKDPQKGRAWINKALKNRSSGWKVGEKQPGYNASDSDSEVKGDAD
ncbi:hypothetical protein CRG98_045170 [Punica granatum]|uniref:Uncharacterized protein n=1 Tax=Punica granatum TaxID=22663 RepID=A0A2I0HRT8_PUNGR|nr:hypothetical protein CRG98_045170 [Punica granatum]